MKTEREIVEYLALLVARDQNIEDDVPDLELRGPFTTTYWSNAAKDNIPQQQLTIMSEDKEFQILVREVKVKK